MANVSWVGVVTKVMCPAHLVWRLTGQSINNARPNEEIVMERRCAICRKGIGPQDQYLANNTRESGAPLPSGFVASTNWTFAHTWCIEMQQFQLTETVRLFIDQCKSLGLKMKLIELRKRPGYKGDKWR